MLETSERGIKIAIINILMEKFDNMQGQEDNFSRENCKDESNRNARY